MSRRELVRRAEILRLREERVWSRFLEPAANVSFWDSRSLDMAASYVGLLHAEAEYQLEQTVSFAINHALEASRRGYSHPVLINALMYYQAQVLKNLGKTVRLVPERKALESDPALAAERWSSSGAQSYWEEVIKDNHGAGIKYVERLFQPLGMELSKKTFDRSCASVGVRRIVRSTPGMGTDLTEFVSLRGRAVHTSSASFFELVRTSTPGQIRLSGRRAVDAVCGLVSLSARRLI